MLLGSRIAIFGGKKLPYDAEVEYISIGVEQICNLGIQPTVETLFKVRASFLTSSGVLHFGIRVSEYANFRIFNYGRILYFDLGDYANQGGRCTTPDVPYHTVMDMEFGNNYIKVDGVEVISATTSTTTLAQSDFLLGGGGASNVYSAQLSTSGVLQRDLIPVRVGNVGYMYDRVSGQLFGNSGTGEFGVGPDLITLTADEIAPTTTQSTKLGLI